jgi:hypothetical protein
MFDGRRPTGLPCLLPDRPKYACSVKDIMERRWPPFAFVSAVLLVLSIALARLPESLVEQIERNSPLTGTEGGWAYRFLVAFAVVQILYGGFWVLRVERVKRAQESDAKVARMSRPHLLGSIARNAAGMIFLTFVYGLAAFLITGQRGGYWLFAVLFVAQGAWYYRLVGDVGRWLGFQPERTARPSPALWRREPDDYCPPIARSLTPVTESMPANPGRD